MNTTTTLNKRYITSKKITGISWNSVITKPRIVASSRPGCTVVDEYLIADIDYNTTQYSDNDVQDTSAAVLVDDWVCSVDSTEV